MNDRHLKVVDNDYMIEHNDRLDKIPGYKMIEKESIDRVIRMRDFLEECGLNIECLDKKSLKLNLVLKLNNMEITKLEKIRALIISEILRHRESGLHMHRYKYKINLRKIITKIYEEKIEEEFYRQRKDV